MMVVPESTVDIFVSYAREDLEFVRQLADELRTRDRSVWVDLEGLYVGEAWWPNLCRAIDAAHAVVFVLSPDWAISVPCQSELNYALQHGKRIVPLAWRASGDMELPPVVQQTHWLLPKAGATLEAIVQALITVLDSDPEWMRGHTRWLQLALDWDRRGRPDALLLRGEHLDEADRWLDGAARSRNPPLVLVQQEFIAASRRADLLRQARARLEEGRSSQALALVLDSTVNNAEELGVDGHRLLFEGLQRLRRCEPLRSEEHDAIGTALDSTGRYIVAGDVWRASVWDLSTRPARRLGAVDALHTDLPLLSPRGDRLLAGASNGAVLWDATTWQPIGSVEADREGSSSAAFSPDGHWLAVAAGEHVWLLAAEDGRLVQEFDHGRTIGIDDLRFDPVGTTLLACSSERLRLWDVVDGRLRYSVAAGTRSALWSARFSADGSWIVAARGNRRISIWRTEDGELSQTIVGKQGDEFRDAWFADGDRIILAFDGLYLRSWDWPGGKGHGREVGHDALFALAPIGRKVALSNGDRSGKIELRDIRTGELIETLGRHEDSVTALAWTDSGEHLVSGDKNGMLVQWAMSTLSVHAVLETHGGAIGHIRALPEAAGVAATCRDGAVRVWRFDASLALRRLEDVMRSVCVSPAAQLAVAVAHDEGVATLFDGGFNQARSRFLPVEDTRACAFSPDGRWLATIGGDAMVYLINPTTLKTVCSWQGPEGAYCLTWDTAGRRLLVAGPRFCVVWNNQRQAPELFLGSDQLYVYKAALSADGRRVCVAEEYIEITGVVHKAVGYGVRIVDIDSGLGVAHLTWGDDPIERRCSCLSFAPDDSKVLVAWVTDGSVWLVDAASGAMIRSFGDEESRKNFADWAPDGRAVITADRNSVEVWNAADGGLIARLDAQASVRAVVFSPNGKLAATVGSHAVWVWECTTWTPLANLFDGVDRFPASAAFNASGDGLIVIEADGQAACYPVSREALCDAARPWLTAVRTQ